MRGQEGRAKSSYAVHDCDPCRSMRRCCMPRPSILVARTAYHLVRATYFYASHHLRNTVVTLKSQALSAARARASPWRGAAHGGRRAFC
eukprot:6172232-Pleurochrysis_carterae.AAC.3